MATPEDIQRAVDAVLADCRQRGEETAPCGCDRACALEIGYKITDAMCSKEVMKRALASIGAKRMKPSHTCHWTGCPREVPPSMWGCKEHWFKLPKTLRDGVWKAYRPGQEIDKRPSQEYLAVAAMVQAWIRGDLTINKDGSIVVHKDIPVPRALQETHGDVRP